MRYFNVFKASLIAASIACVAGHASAALVVANTTADLSKVGGSLPYDVWAGAYFSGDNAVAAGAIPTFNPITLNEGDSFEINVSFLPGQQLNLVDLMNVWPVLQADDEQIDALTGYNGRMQLIDAGGNVIATAIRNDNFLAGIYIGNPFLAEEFDQTSPLLISGVRFSGDVTFSSVGPRVYDAIGLGFSGTPLEVITQNVNAVPEPSSLVLMAAGLFAVGVAGRRKCVL